MIEKQRKLLPYEHQLIDALDISEQEYREFVAQQHIYTDVKEGTVLDVRNWEAVAIVLTIVGILFQVAAVLLAPKPPQQQGRQRQTRDETFAPRFGFNTVQELAKYGDPVNLIYTNASVNQSGGVRVATSLLWSSVKSFGSAQYIQLLLLLGAGGIGAVAVDRAAFGQTPLRSLISQNYWLYFRSNGTGAIRGVDRIAGGDGEVDPAAVNVGSRNLYRVVPSATGASGDGFSHALSPASANQIGAYSPVPLGVNIIIRNEAGVEQSAPNGISASLSSNTWGTSASSSRNNVITVGTILTVQLAATTRDSSNDAERESAEQRRALSSAFDNAGIFKLGSAKFSVLSVNIGSTDEGNMKVILRCIESGIAPSVPYGRLPVQAAQQIANADPSYRSLKERTASLLNEDKRNDVKTPSQLLAKGNIFSAQIRRGFQVTKGRPIGSTTYTVIAFKRNLTKEEKDILADYIAYEEAVKSGTVSDDLFFLKALVKIEQSSYETVSPCHIVDFALKAQVYRRISGRQSEYGTKKEPGFAVSDNGIKMRSSMFLVKYKVAGASRYSYVPGIFVIRRAAENDSFVYFRFNSGAFGEVNARHWQFQIEPIHDSIAEIKAHRLSVNGRCNFFYLENSGAGRSVALPGGAALSFTGYITSSSTFLPPVNKSPALTNEWDLFSNTADTQLQMSLDRGPEITLSAVTEQIRESFGLFPGLYNDISLVGFNLYSGRSVQDLRSLTMFVTLGRRSRLLRTSGTVNNIAWGQSGYQYLSPTANGYANNAPDIFIDTILDYNDGIGRYAGDLFSIDLEQLARSKKFCEVNRLFMDGVIAEPRSWREFWTAVAGFSLLELAKQDGREVLLPAVPYNPTTGAISRTIAVSALFNQGNILEDSYKEEFIDYGSNTEDIIATVIYRRSERDGIFPRNNSVEVRLTNTVEANALRETIDLSAFVTTREQAIIVGKYLCQIRRYSRRAIEFKTFPTDSFVSPGGYIYVELAQNQWNGIHTGTIGNGGALDMPLSSQVRNGTYQFLLYNPNATTSGTVFKAGIAVASSTATSLAAYKGHVFVLGTAIRNKRVFRVTEVEMNEEGEVTVRGVEHPTDANGLSLISNGLVGKVPGLFTIDERPE
jgi:hypothetical protein